MGSCPQEDGNYNAHDDQDLLRMANIFCPLEKIVVWILKIDDFIPAVQPTALPNRTAEFARDRITQRPRVFALYQRKTRCPALGPHIATDPGNNHITPRPPEP